MTERENSTLVERNLDTLLAGYDTDNLALGTLGSHSALDVAEGAMRQGMQNFVVAKYGRHRPYETDFRQREQGVRIVGSVQNVRVINDWKAMAGSDTIEWMRSLSGIFVPNRSLAVYLRDKETHTYEPIINMGVPFFGNIDLLEAEERSGKFAVEYNQDFLAEKAGLPIPERFESPKKINKKVLVKASHVAKNRDFERNFISVSSEGEYFDELEKLLGETPQEDRAKVEEDFLAAPIQEDLGRGPVVNLNFFYSPTWDSLELLGTDTRSQFPNGEEMTHTPISLRESLLHQALDMGQQLVVTVREYYPKGIVGPFAIQCMGDKEGRLRPIDLSLRIPGSPDSTITPTAFYLYGRPMSFGERIAIELKDAVKTGNLSAVLS